MSSGKAVIAQGGGPTAVINQSLVGAVLAAREGQVVRRIYGARHGVRGIVDEAFLDLTQETTDNLEAVAATPCSALGSTRDKPDIAYCREIFRVLAAHDVSTFFYIGGNDSADTVRIVAEEAQKAGRRLDCIHIPKTIDNDLTVTDHTPGFGSAARFVASAFAGVDRDNAALPGVYIGVVMGRHAGFLTAASALGRANAADGPHLIYLPEKVFDPDAFVAAVNKIHNKIGRCVVAVSEGIHDAEGTPIVTRMTREVETDAHGNVQLSGTGALADMLVDLIKTKTNIKRVRGDTFGYLQRSFLGCVSDTDAVEARAVGATAVNFATSGDREGPAAGSVVIRRTGDYVVDFSLADLKDIGGKTKVVTPEMIAANGHDVTRAFLDYARPLVGAAPIATAKLRAPDVPKILNV